MPIFSFALRRNQAASLFATTSMAALLLGAAPAQAGQNFVNQTIAAVSNPAGTATTSIVISSSTVTGNVSNAGTISPGKAGIGGSSIIGLLASSSSVGGQIVNSGTITASGGNTALGIFVGNASNTGGGIANSGTITASGAKFNTGIVVNGHSAVSGGIANSGTIKASGASAVGIGVGDATVSGGIANSGTINVSGAGNIDGINVVQNAVSGGISNGGTIGATGGKTNNGIVVQGSTIMGTLSNGGTILASGAGAFGIGILTSAVAGGAPGGGVLNSGTISVSGGAVASAILVQGKSSVAGGIVNSGTIRATAPAGVAVGIGVTTNGAIVSGGIANSGTISANGKTGIGIRSASPITGGITNTGTISGSTAALDLTQEIGGSTPVNQAGGALTGSVRLSGNADILNFSGGTIFGAVTGLAGNQDVVAISGTGASFAPTASVRGVSAFTQGAGSRLTLQVTPTQAPSISAGTMTLRGTLSVAPVVNNGATKFAATQTFKNVFVSASPITGSFASVASPVTLFQASVAPDATTPNALDTTLSLSQTGLAASAQNLTQSLRLGLDAPQVLGQAVQNRLTASGGVLNEPGLGDRHAALAGHANLWARGADQFGGASASSAAPGYDVNRAAPLIGGVDWHFDHGLVFGAAGTYVASSASFKDGSHANVSSYQGAAYAGWSGGPWYATASTVASFNEFATTRQLAPVGLPGAATASPSGQSYAGYAETGTRWLLPAAGLNLTPYAALSYVNAHIHAFSEAGGFGTLSVNGADGNSLSTTLGLRASTQISLSNHGVLMPELRIGWSHEFLDASQTISGSLTGVPGSAFSAIGINFGRDSALIGTGVSAELSPAAKVFVDYDGKLGEHFQEHALSGGMRLRF